MELLHLNIQGDHSNIAEFPQLLFHRRSESDERITVISITPHPVISDQNIRNKQKKSNLKQSSKFPAKSQYEEPQGRKARRDTSDESNLEEYQLEGRIYNLTLMLSFEC